MSTQPMHNRNFPSDEASAEQLRLAGSQGDAFGRALQAMSNMDSHGRLQRAQPADVRFDMVQIETGQKRSP